MLSVGHPLKYRENFSALRVADMSTTLRSGLSGRTRCLSRVMRKSDWMSRSWISSSTMWLHSLNSGSLRIHCNTTPVVQYVTLGPKRKYQYLLLCHEELQKSFYFTGRQFLCKSHVMLACFAYNSNIQAVDLLRAGIKLLKPTYLLLEVERTPILSGSPQTFPKFRPFLPPHVEPRLSQRSVEVACIRYVQSPPRQIPCVQGRIVELGSSYHTQSPHCVIVSRCGH